MSIREDVLSVAPMIQWTDRYWRYYFRGISRRTLLYTEMILGNAIFYNQSNLDPFIGHDDVEHPLAVQLGGNDPERLGEAAYLIQQYGPFCEINLNAGCPSNKAKRGGFGAELMLHPEKIREILHSMQRRATNTEVSLKCRIAVTGKDTFEDLLTLMRNTEQSGVRKVILHARKCELHGLSPAQNRTVPPLHPEVVHRLITLFPNLQFVLNGGITNMDVAQQHLGWSTAPSEWQPPVHGVMIGREAYNHPWTFSYADTTFYRAAADPLPSRGELLERYLDYAERAQEGRWFGARCCTLTKPLHNLFHGCAGNADYKHALDAALVQHSKQVDGGHMSFSDMMLQVVHETVSEEVLELRGPPPNVTAVSADIEEDSCCP